VIVYIQPVLFDAKAVLMSKPTPLLHIKGVEMQLNSLMWALSLGDWTDPCGEGPPSTYRRHMIGSHRQSGCGVQSKQA
jgi:hypothetical protein